MSILDDTVDLLNEAYSLDPEWIEKLIQHCPEVNEKICDHPTIQCGTHLGEVDDQPRAGVIGLLNGILRNAGALQEGEYLVAEYDGRDMKLTGFGMIGRPAPELSPIGFQDVTKTAAKVAAEAPKEPGFMDLRAAERERLEELR